MAAAYPEKWAAIAPICGRGEMANANKIKHIPCWSFCGDKDRTELVEACRGMTKALQAAGGSPRYSEYPHVGHNSWDPAYVNRVYYSVWPAVPN